MEAPMMNLTSSQEEILEEFNPEYDTYMTFYRTVMWVTLVTTIIKFGICLVVLGADIFLVTIYCRNPKLRCRTNSYLLHYAIFNIIAIVSTPLFFIFMELFRIGGMGAVFYYYCINVQIESFGLGMCFLMGVCLLIEWIFEVYDPVWKTRIQAIQRFAIVLSYVISFGKLVLTVGTCFDTIGAKWFLSYFYGAILIINIATNVTNHVSKPQANKKSYTLSAANVIILSWLPMFVYEICWNCFRGSSILEDILTLISFIPEWIGYGSPIVLLFVLGKTNKDFKRVYITAFKKSTKNYEGDDLEESTEERKTEENFTVPTDIQVL